VVFNRNSIATTNRLNPIRQPIRTNQIVKKFTLKIRRINIPNNITRTKMVNPNQALTTNRTNIHMLLNRNLQLTITANTKPNASMRTLNLHINGRMFQLIPSRAINSYALIKNPNNPTILICPQTARVCCDKNQAKPSFAYPVRLLKNLRREFSLPHLILQKINQLA